ncbi:MAG: hypothetical protein IIA75_04355 [Proteobacteria bacterium]|nr:hypothetical protein [Pseudomonadota bacterium]
MSTPALPVLVARALLLATLVNGPVFATQEQESIETAESAPVDTGEIQALRDALAGIESDQGAYAQALPEQLISLGFALQQQGRHKEAVTVFKRGGHLSRINDGLYSAEQIPFLQGEISSNLAVGELAEVDQRQHYLLQIQQRSLASGEQYIQALMQQASWQYNAYELGVGDKEQIFDRLLSMWDLYRLAIGDIMDREGATSPMLLPPLHGMLKAQYLISAYQANFSRAAGNSAQTEHFRFAAYLSQNFKKGNEVIRAIYNVEQTRHGKHGLPVAETLVMLGDWMLWHDKRQSANNAYLDALKELAELDDAQIQIEHMFGEPVALPDIDGIRPLPPAVAVDQGDILLEFRINPRGHVIDLVRLDEGEDDKAKANRLMRKLRKTKFRPRFAGGEAIITDKIIRAYEIVQ